MTQGAGLLVLVIISAIALFLLARALPAFQRAGLGFLTEKTWFPDAAPARFGIAALAFGTVVSSVVALMLAVPVALGSALFLTELAPPRLGRWVGHLIDLLAAVPSVVYGLWGVYYLVPRLVPVGRFLDRTLGFIPLFDSRTNTYGRSLFAASVVLAVMVLPIVAAISREVFRQVPVADREAALALGATKWESIRLAVLPYSRGGIVGAVMLGLGRALGETIAVALVLAASFKVDFHILEPGGNSIAANIATKFGEAGAHGREALIASGLVLFAITLVVNVVARGVVYRTGLAAEGKP
ncbi:MAG TPA: phosphate ABC transporter permease subunit PstC [Acidimicrobiales bacterium]|jgi:phosphate transport system permease protein|nr:phosphate ABC transporter permease subunit PstC [Acidimicrobiales bacterium]